MARLIETVEELEERLSRPSPQLIELVTRLGGDLIVLGVGGKMGPTLARMARRALADAGHPASVYGVARFSQPGVRQALEVHGVRPIACDLLDHDAVQALPDASGVIFMAGQKFGTTGAQATTWAMNTVLPAYVAQRYAGVPTVVFSSGNIYPFVSILQGGATEVTPPAPIGEYAQSALGRERVFEYFSLRYGTPVLLFRLNYAVELRYGVVLDVARKVMAGEPIDLTMGHANLIWQGDANDFALRSLELAASPPRVLNVTGPEIVPIRWLAIRLGELLGREPVFTSEEAPTALLSNAAAAHRRFGYPRVPLDAVIEWVAHWVKIGGPTLDKPTHYEVRDGRF